MTDVVVLPQVPAAQPDAHAGAQCAAAGGGGGGAAAAAGLHSHTLVSSS